MYICAHLFTGILLGLGVFHITGDRRAFPVCIAGSLLPDLLDKPLMLLVPGVFGSTRTIGHSLLLVSVLVLTATILWYRNRTILGIAFAVSVLLHQISDLMWTFPVTWFFPLNGMFPFATVSGNFWDFLLLELTNPSEWVFALASGILVVTGFAGTREYRLPLFSSRRPDILLYATACILGSTALYLIAGMNPALLPFPSWSGEPDKTFVAGLVALCGAIIFMILPGMNRPAA
jgi:membrane-bound metal-dependent hydrolase YbcI (DUF457 family)